MSRLEAECAVEKAKIAKVLATKEHQAPAEGPAVEKRNKKLRKKKGKESVTAEDTTTSSNSSGKYGREDKSQADSAGTSLSVPNKGQRGRSTSGAAVAALHYLARGSVERQPLVDVEVTETAWQPRNKAELAEARAQLAGASSRAEALEEALQHALEQQRIAVERKNTRAKLAEALAPQAKAAGKRHASNSPKPARPQT